MGLLPDFRENDSLRLQTGELILIDLKLVAHSFQFSMTLKKADKSLWVFREITD
jgi:hypothetical protein